MKKPCNCQPPCPPPCPPPEPPCVICPEVMKEYAYYSQNNRLYNTALFGAIRFENEPVQTSAFEYDTGIIQFLKAGTYLLTYIVNFPANTSADTTLALQVNNANVTGTVRVIQMNTSDGPYTAVAQAIITVNEFAAARLSSSRIIDISASAGNTVASLTIEEL